MSWHVVAPDGGPLPEEARPFRRVQSSLKPVLDVRYAIERPGGDRIQLSVNTGPILSPSGDFEGVVSIFEDITEQMRDEMELRKHKEHIEEMVRQRTVDLSEAFDQEQAANAAKSVFLAHITHELRTPLHAILGFSNLLVNDPTLSAGQRKHVEILRRSGRHLLHLINDVLDMARIEAGRLNLENAPLDLSALVHDVIDLMQVRAGKNTWNSF
jgi:signal transduction histidine kinase